LLRDPRTLLVVSADLSHGLSYENAVIRDRETLDRILSLDPDWQADQDNRSCGRYPVGVLLELARKGHWRPVAAALQQQRRYRRRQVRRGGIWRRCLLWRLTDAKPD
jgi:AmmeMemoRadiSam system protein B